MIRNLLMTMLCLMILCLLAACGDGAQDVHPTNTQSSLLPTPVVEAAAPSPATNQAYTTYTNEGLGFSTVHPEGWQVETEDVEDPKTGQAAGKTVRFFPTETLAAEPSPLAGMSVWVFPARVGSGVAPATERDCVDLITRFVESSGHHLVSVPIGLEIDGHKGAQATYCEGDPQHPSWVAYLTVFAAEDRLFRINALSNADDAEPVPEAYAELLSSFEVLPLTVALAPTPLPSPTTAPPSPTATATTTPTHTPAPTPTPTVPPIPTDTPAPTPTPRRLATGTFITQAVPRDGLGELTIDNGQELDALAILADPAGAPHIAVYIRSYEAFTITGIRDGSYRLFFSLGEDWDEAGARFTRRPTFSKFEEPLPYQTIPTAGGTQYTVWQVTLHPVVGGAAETEQISEDEFPTLR